MYNFLHGQIPFKGCLSKVLTAYKKPQRIPLYGYVLRLLLVCLAMVAAIPPARGV